jgi:peroxiredoxin
MPLRRLILGWALIAACAAQAADREPAFGTPPSSAPLPLWSRVAADQPATPLVVGDRAPRFSYLGPDGGWHEFSDLSAKGPVLLVFGATEADLKALEASRPAFSALGVNPAVVMDMRAGSAARLARRLRLSSPIISDPVCAIAGLYDSLSPASLRHAPAFFLVDKSRTIRVLERGSLPPTARIIELSAHALGQQVPEPARAASS